MKRDRWLWDLLFVGLVYVGLIYVGWEYARGQQHRPAVVVSR